MPGPPRTSPWGVVIATAVLAAWTCHLAYALGPHGPSGMLGITLHGLLQTYLFTGLFITGHDAMHGTVSPRRGVNTAFGWLASLLFAGMSYRRLVVNHRAHHHAPTGERDPDFGQRSQSFLPWWLTFMFRYTTVLQIGVMAVTYNVLAHVLHVPEWRLWAYWVGPALLATLQLFYFGTYLPHRGPFTDDMAPHRARSQAPNHAWAMLSCYFFGYHWEHHESPGTPWWRLWRQRNERIRLRSEAQG